MDVEVSMIGVLKVNRMNFFSSLSVSLCIILSIGLFSSCDNNNYLSPTEKAEVPCKDNIVGLDLKGYGINKVIGAPKDATVEIVREDPLYGLIVLSVIKGDYRVQLEFYDETSAFGLITAKEAMDIEVSMMDESYAKRGYEMAWVIDHLDEAAVRVNLSVDPTLVHEHFIKAIKVPNGMLMARHFPDSGRPPSSRQVMDVYEALSCTNYTTVVDPMELSIYQLIGDKEMTCNVFLPKDVDLDRDSELPISYSVTKDDFDLEIYLYDKFDDKWKGKTTNECIMHELNNVQRLFKDELLDYEMLAGGFIYRVVRPELYDLVDCGFIKVFVDQSLIIVVYSDSVNLLSESKAKSWFNLVSM